MRVALYVRVSTDEQAKEGFSIPAQKERLRAFCQSQGWDIVNEYIEEGFSAKDTNRPKMQTMLKDIKKGTCDMVLVYKLDRLTRSVLDLYNLLQVFDSNNVSFRSSTEVYDTSTAMGRLFITLVAALAQWERENLAERVIFGMEQMIDEGKKPGGHSPYGYSFDKDFNCTIIEHEAEMVKYIFKLYMDGFGFHSIKNRLNELNIKPRLALEWNHNTIRDILMNDMYIGTYRWGRKVIHDHHEAIIQNEVFNSVSKLLASKTANHPRKGKFPLTGILKCGNCEMYPIQGYYDKRDQKTYYRCMSCNRMTDSRKILEPLFEELEKLITSKDYFLSLFKDESEPAIDQSKIKIELEKLKSQKEKWYDVFMDENNPIPKETLFEKINQINIKESQLEELLDEQVEYGESPEEKYNRIKLLSDFKHQYDSANDFQKKELLSSIFESVVLYRPKGKLQQLRVEFTIK